MIICSCNVISDRHLRACVKPNGDAADSARDVFHHLGRKPKCGRCVRHIHSLFERAGATHPSHAAQSLDESSETPGRGWALAAE